ncbi:uncharacterized protein BP01DRAFT_358467 [Aspergillus saccharolyticus JOP 1030-1]|uniref:Uncharacterized protein n=1 Tax=Aspergillus saccharolyticus JOP 1030-1 TaxID=1450539 RepID=A0A318Z833_9EURO|nr:hypothetical protein BP01DRAFT_358467 [Aspergillus saccharolyticus JOP 1030-1]PYH43475.1 hypothetical protein BP01DRAFT_358467 [Aspergillus saccharolyticus JOP 1030-1]
MMKGPLVNRALGSLVAMIAAINPGSASSSLSENPLATPDQKILDALAIEIYQNNTFTVLQAEAKLAYQPQGPQTSAFPDQRAAPARDYTRVRSWYVGRG